jgi:hypothetical protein
MAIEGERVPAGTCHSMFSSQPGQPFQHERQKVATA